MKRQYTGKLFFYLDVIATLSLLLDVDFIIDPLEALAYADPTAEVEGFSSSVQEQAVYDMRTCLRSH